MANRKKIDKLFILRRFTQIGVGTILLQSYFKVFASKQIYDGPLKNGCVPGLLCHACPTATMGCPIGMLQHFAATHRFPFYLIGILGIIGLISGRFTCGWLCPFGLLQDAMHWFKQLKVRIPIWINYVKYPMLVIVTIVIPYITQEHWFSKLCPSGALVAGIPWTLWNPIDPVFDMAVIPTESVGTMFWIKLWILGICLILFMFIKRPFCRTICPLGAIYALFNRMSLVSMKVTNSCPSCGMCPDLCPMDLQVETEINSENCIKCLDCTQCDHVEFYWNLPWRKKPEDSKVIDCNLSCDGSPCSNIEFPDIETNLPEKEVAEIDR